MTDLVHGARTTAVASFEPSANQIALLEAQLQHPRASWTALAAKVGVDRGTCCRWRRGAPFRAWWDAQLLAHAQRMTGAAALALVAGFTDPTVKPSVAAKAAVEFLRIFKPALGDEAVVSAMGAAFAYGATSVTVEAVDAGTGRAVRAHAKRGRELGAVSTTGYDPAQVGGIAAATQVTETIERERTLLADLDAGLHIDGPAPAPKPAVVLSGDSPGELVR